MSWYEVGFKLIFFLYECLSVQAWYFEKIVLVFSSWLCWAAFAVNHESLHIYGCSYWIFAYWILLILEYIDILNYYKCWYMTEGVFYLIFLKTVSIFELLYIFSYKLQNQYAKFQGKKSKKKNEKNKICPDFRWDYCNIFIILRLQIYTYGICHHLFVFFNFCQKRLIFFNVELCSIFWYFLNTQFVCYFKNIFKLLISKSLMLKYRKHLCFIVTLYLALILKIILLK